MKDNSIKLDEVFKNKNLHAIKKEFIVAGPRESIYCLFRHLLYAGAACNNISKSNCLETSKQRCVLFVRNEGISKKFCVISLHEVTWWEYWYKPLSYRKPKIKTYNFPKQVKQIINLLILKDIPTLKSE